MSDMHEFSRDLHTPEWWAQDNAAAEEQLAPFQGIDPSEMTPEEQFRLMTIAITELGRLRLIVRALALEEPAPVTPPKLPRAPRRKKVEANGD
jgi:hypothetical protein